MFGRLDTQLKKQTSMDKLTLTPEPMARRNKYDAQMPREDGERNSGVATKPLHSIEKCGLAAIVA